jgi:Domain of unknown function (DUF6894)
MAPMPRFLFFLHGPDGARDDVSGTQLEDLGEAYAHAHQIIRELKRDGEFDPGGYSVIVRDAAGNLIYSISL